MAWWTAIRGLRQGYHTEEETYEEDVEHESETLATSPCEETAMAFLGDRDSLRPSRSGSGAGGSKGGNKGGDESGNKSELSSGRITDAFAAPEESPTSESDSALVALPAGAEDLTAILLEKDKLYAARLTFR